MGKFDKQAEAINHIKSLLAYRGLEIEPGIVLIGEDEPWQAFEHNGRCIGIDLNSGVWVGTIGGEWQCISASCTTGSAIEAVEFLIKPVDINKAFE